jgi:PAS domain S-box-containing protein
VPESDRRARLRLAAQNGAVRALVNATSLEEGTRELLREVCQNLGWAVGAIWMPSVDARVLETRTLWASPGAGVTAFSDTTRATRFPPGTGLPGRVWASGEPAWIVDVTEDPEFTRAEAARAVGLHGAFAVPIPLDGARRGVLEFFSREVLAPDPELLETMSAVGGHLGQFLQRRQAQAALRATEAQFLTFASTVPDATFIIDESSRIVYVNDAVRQIFGYSPSELQGAPLTRLMPERHRRPHMEGLRRFLETGERRVAWEGVAMEGLRRDGTEVPLEITYGTFERDGRRFFTGIARDVTERRHTEEQLRFQARLLDAVGEAVVAADLDGRILYWNAYAEQLFGWTAGEVLDRNVEEIAPGVLPPESGRVKARLAGGGRWSSESTVRGRDGREFPAWITLSPILDGNGRLLGIIGTAIEIQERIRREEGLRFLGDASRVLASSLDYATTLRSVATLAVPHLGDWCLVHARNPEDGAIAPVARVTPPGATDAVDALESLLTGDDGVANRVLSSDTRLIWPDGGGATDLPGERLRQAGIHSLLAVPLRARGTALGIITLVSTTAARAYDSLDADIAEELGHRAGLAVDNARLYREAQEGNRAKADFLAVVSHELRTPLNAIAGYADLLAGGIAGPLTELQQRHVERIKVGAGHLAHLIDEVLSYARVETDRERLQLEVTDVAAVAREAAVVLEPDAREKGLPLRADVPEKGPVMLTDPGKVRQIVVNLLSNAVKYTDEGEVRVRVRPAGAGVEIQVSDTGIGIDPKAQDRIFEPFWQAEAPNTRSVGGTGLGLSVSRRLAGLLQGTIEVASDVGKGSTFTVRLPDLTGTPHHLREAGPDAAADDGTELGPG